MEMSRDQETTTTPTTTGPQLDHRKIKSQTTQAKKLVFIAQIFEKGKKEKTPAPGQYKMFKNKKDFRQSKDKSHRSYAYLDGVQYEASTTPGVGSYNTTINRPKSANHQTKHKQTFSKHKQALSKPDIRVKRGERTPSMGSYNPQLEEHKSFSGKSKGYNEWGRVQRFRRSNSGSNIGPGTYLRGDQDKLVH